VINPAILVGGDRHFEVIRHASWVNALPKLQALAQTLAKTLSSLDGDFDRYAGRDIHNQ
jgi:hypothetical protein